MGDFFIGVDRVGGCGESWEFRELRELPIIPSITYYPHKSPALLPLPQSRLCDFSQNKAALPSNR